MTDASNALNPGDDGAAAAMEWLDRQAESATTPPEATEETEAPAVVEHAEEAPSTEEADTEATTDEAPAQDADLAEETPDRASVYDNLPDEILADLPDDLPDEVLDALNKGYMRQADYTRKTQEAAAMRKEAAALEEAAQSWQALMADSELLELMSRAKELRDQEETEPFEYAEATPEEIDQRVNELVEQRLRAQDQAVVEAETAAESWKASLVDPMTEAQSASGLEGDDWLAVTSALADHLDSAGLNPLETINADNVDTWLAPHIAAVKLDLLNKRQEEAKAKSKQDATRSARASSPAPARTSSAAPAKPWKAREDGKATPEELRAYTLKTLADEGIDLTQLGT